MGKAALFLAPRLKLPQRQKALTLSQDRAARISRDSESCPSFCFLAHHVPYLEPTLAVLAIDPLPQRPRMPLL